MLKKVIDFVKHLFYTSFIGNWYFNFLLWWDRIKFEQDLKINYSSKNKVVLSAKQVAYEEGIKTIKQRIGSLVEIKSKDEYEKVLSEVKELISLARYENKDADYLYKLYVKKDRDIHNNTDKAKMVETRINHYKELQKFNEERELIKQIKKAKKEGDINLSKELEKQWTKKYGRII